MASSPVKSHPTQQNATFCDGLEVPEPAVATVLFSDVKYAMELNFDATDVVVSFKKQYHTGSSVRNNQVKYTKTCGQRLG